MSQLKGLLSKNKRPIIINGKQLLLDRSPVLIGLNEYHVEYGLLGRDDVKVTQDQGDSWIRRSFADFYERFGKHLEQLGIQDDEDSVETTVDPFTGAIVFENRAYRSLYDPQMHEPGVQHRPAVAQLLKDFTIYYTSAYMDSYINMYNKRISSPRFPISTRSHFVAGLFQPLIVSSPGLRFPLEFGLNAWLKNVFDDCEEVLERPNDFPRKLSLSCVAMCDIAQKFSAGVVTELDRKEWMLMCMMVLLSQLDPEESLALSKRYAYLAQRIRKRRETMMLFSAMHVYADKLRTAVSVV